MTETDRTLPTSTAAASATRRTTKAAGGEVRRLPPTVVLGTTVAALLVATVISAGTGQNHVPMDQVVGSVLHHLGIPLGPMPDLVGEQTLWQVRLPRVVLAVLVGASLACAGALLQGVFANPLAEPGIIGVSSGAALGAAAMIAIAGLGTAVYAVAGGAFVMGLLTTALVYAMARSNGRTEVVTLVLTGVAVTAIAGGVIAYLTFAASPTARDQIVFWQMGSLNQAGWSAVAIVAPLVVIGTAWAMTLARRVDLLALGEYAARHLGVDVERVRKQSVVLVALLTAAAVAFSGIILFVGLVVPHLMRLLIGPRHRLLLPASVLGGALLLTVADLGARTLVDYADLPIGMITAVVGGPVFLYLLRRERSSHGGWA